MRFVSAFDSIEYESIKPLRRYKKQLKKINQFREHFEEMTIEELKEEALSWGGHFDRKNKKQVNELYALIREVCGRLLGKYQYDVQILGALAALDRNIIEMSTGSGKTITLILPVVAFGLEHQGCNVLTVNEYLSERDFKETKVIYEFFGLSCAYVNNDMHPTEQRKGYDCDITYSTNSSLGFAFLNSCLASDIGRDIKIISRPLNVAIIDEVDEVLMDDAINPLIIAGEVPMDLVMSEVEHNGKKYKTKDIIQKLTKVRFMEIDEDDTGKPVIGDKAWTEIQELLGVDDSIFSNPEFLHIIYNGITAIFKHKIYEDYIVASEPDPDSDSRIILIDKATGRLSHGRTLNDNLHSFVEMKEGVFSGKATDSSIQITYQVLFNLFKQITGVTGTVGKCYKEFYDIYNTGVVRIPDRLPNQLKESTRLYSTTEFLYDDLVKEVAFYLMSRFPVLIGCETEKTALLVSNILNSHNIEHRRLLSTDDDEDFVIAKAGQVGSVVVTTDIMGRGTDIKIDETDHEKGLVVFQIGNRPNSRVERQFAGRAARQGEPGRYFRMLSLTDMRDINFSEQDLVKIIRYQRKYQQEIDTYSGDILMKSYAPYYNEIVDMINMKLYGDESSNSQNRIHNYKTMSIVDNVQMSWVYQVDEMRRTLKLFETDEITHEEFIDYLIDISIEYDGLNYDELYNLLKDKSLYELQESLYNHISNVILVELKQLRHVADDLQKTVGFTSLTKLEIKQEEYMKRLVYDYLKEHEDKVKYSIYVNFKYSGENPQ